MEALHLPEDHFLNPFVQKRREMAHPVPTKGFLQKQPCYLGPMLKPTHLPLSHPFYVSPKDIARSDITR